MVTTARKRALAEVSVGTARRLRRLLVQGAILAVVGGSVACIVLDVELWPLSNYPMYSQLQGRRFEILAPIGITAAGERRLETRGWFPLDATRLRTALERMRAQPDGRTRLARALAWIARRHERARREGRIDDPPLVAVALDRVRWRLAPNAATRDVPERTRRVALWRVPPGARVAQ